MATENDWFMKQVKGVADMIGTTLLRFKFRFGTGMKMRKEDSSTGLTIFSKF